MWAQLRSPDPSPLTPHLTQGSSWSCSPSSPWTSFSWRPPRPATSCPSSGSCRWCVGAGHTGWAGVQHPTLCGLPALPGSSGQSACVGVPGPHRPPALGFSAAQVPSCTPAFWVFHPHLSFWLVLLSLLAAPTPGSVCPPICPEVSSERGEGRLIRSGGWRALGLPLGNTAEAHGPPSVRLGAGGGQVRKGGRPQWWGALQGEWPGSASHPPAHRSCDHGGDRWRRAAATRDICLTAGAQEGLFWDLPGRGRELTLSGSEWHSQHLQAICCPCLWAQDWSRLWF